MTMFEWHGTLIDNASDRLAFWIEKTREDKATWVPSTDESCNTRSALEVGSECVNANRRNAAFFSGKEPAKEQIEYKTIEDCARELRASGKELCTVVRNLTPDALTQNYQTKFGSIPGVMLIQMALANLYYHGGQVNMIQLLYGDPTFHLPGRD
jgi:hypothetical protein